MLGRRIGETDQLGRTTNYEYDAAGRLTAVELPEVVDADPLSPTYGELLRPRYTYGYDAVGNQTSITDAEGRTTTFTYDHAGRQLTRTLPLGRTERFVYDHSALSAGQMVLHVDFEGRVTQYVYDNTAASHGGGNGRLIAKRYFAARRTTRMQSAHRRR